MPITARQFGFKPNTNALNITGYTDQGILVIQDGTPTWGSHGDVHLSYPTTMWHMGPDESRADFDYVICYTVNVEGSFTKFNTEGTVGDAGYFPGDSSDQSGYLYNGTAVGIAFKGATAENFVGVAEDLTGQSFDDADAAATWLNDNSCWTNHPVSGNSPTPATSATTLATSATTIAENPRGEATEAPEPTLATSATTEAPSGGEPSESYSYFTFTNCDGMSNAGVLRYAGTSPNVNPGNAIDVQNYIQPAKWNGDRNGLIGDPTDEAAWNAALLKWTFTDPVILGICEG